MGRASFVVVFGRRVVLWVGESARYSHLAMPNWRSDVARNETLLKVNTVLCRSLLLRMHDCSKKH
jgi:hypothetical protein